MEYTRENNEIAQSVKPNGKLSAVYYHNVEWFHESRGIYKCHCGCDQIRVYRGNMRSDYREFNFWSHMDNLTKCTDCDETILLDKFHHCKYCKKYMCANQVIAHKISQKYRQICENYQDDESDTSD